MTDIVEIVNKPNPKAKILVIGIGGGGGKILNRIIEEGVEGVEFIAINTDSQDLAINKAPTILQIGAKQNPKGLGAGGRPEKGMKAAEEDADKIQELLEGADMVFLTCGMGGGTGTGATPVVAMLAKEMGILTVAVVTKPFFMEGMQRAANAELGIEKLKENVDSLIVCPNDKLSAVIPPNASMKQALKKSDEVLLQAVQGITDLINKTGDINLDFADVETVMKDKGLAHIGVGRGKGDQRVLDATRLAVDSPLTETSIANATDIIINISAEAGMEDTQMAINYVKDLASSGANIIMGISGTEEQADEVTVTVVATGMPVAGEVAPPDPRLQMPGRVAPTAGFASRPVVPTQPAYDSAARTTAAPTRSAFAGVSESARPVAPAPAVRPAAPVSPASGTMGIQNPQPVRSSVQPKEVNIPSFLSKKDE